MFSIEFYQTTSISFVFQDSLTFDSLSAAPCIYKSSVFGYYFRQYVGLSIFFIYLLINYNTIIKLYSNYIRVE